MSFSSSRAWLRRGLAAAWLATAVLLLIATLAWFGYRAVRGWRASAELLATRRAGETANLLVSAITRDMRAVQSAVLSSPRTDEFMFDPPYDVRDLAASAFARYPYPESFFAWRGTASPSSVLFFNRADRRPAWAASTPVSSRFPVVVASHPAVARALLEHIEADAKEGRRFSTFNLQLGVVPYQVVTRLLYRDALREHMEAAFGFMVNLSWARARYFDDLTHQVARIGNAGSGLSLAVFDDAHRRVAAVPPTTHGGAVVRREFALFFFDPLVVEHDAAPRPWAVEVGIANDATFAEAVRASNGTLLMLAGAAAALAVGLMSTLRAVRASARVAEIRSDFVSTVTHELKTPIATIRAIGDTLARERVTDPDARLEYAQMVVQESKRLSRLVDNLLAYSRVTDVAEVYSLEPVDVHAVVEEVLQSFRTQLAEHHFTVHVDLAADLLPVHADRTAVTLMLDNLVDNAIRYSTHDRRIEIAGRRDGLFAILEIRDHGSGIAESEIARVTRRFYRGRGAASGGSGLGLAIVSRIVSDHGGSIAIDSAIDRGTIVRITLPLAEHG